MRPDYAAQQIEVKVHAMANPRLNRANQHLPEHLNAAEFTYLGTNLRLVYTEGDDLQK